MYNSFGFVVYIIFIVVNKYRYHFLCKSKFNEILILIATMHMLVEFNSVNSVILWVDLFAEYIHL